MTNKKKSILFIAEPRSVYDTIWIKDDEIFSESAKLVDNIGTIKTLLGADEVFYTSASPIGSDNENATIDYEYKNLYTAWVYQGLIEGYLSDDIMHQDESCHMGPCFYRDGYALLDKSKGFGNYSLTHTKDERPVVQKLDEYIRTLALESELSTIFILNDGGYSEKIVDYLSLIKDLGINIVLFIPAKPFCAPPIGEISGNKLSSFYSERNVVYGVNDCMSKYIKELNDALNQGAPSSGSR